MLTVIILESIDVVLKLPHTKLRVCQRRFTPATWKLDNKENT